MRLPLPRAALALALLPALTACDINNKNVDASAASDEDTATSEEDTDEGAEDTASEPEDTAEASEDSGPTQSDYTVVSGCDWLKGTWTFVDCRSSASADFTFTSVGNCQFQASGQSALLIGAVAWASDSGFILVLNDGQRCQGFFDGTHLDGTCAAVGLASVDPCWFSAGHK